MTLAADGDVDGKQRLRLWLSLLRATRTAENHLREFLRIEHGATLPRFDVMAALYRHPEGMTMTELSRRLLVSNGNATAIVDRLEADGLVAREPAAGDRRTVNVGLTKRGRAQFKRLAADHEREINRLFGGLSGLDVARLTNLMTRLSEGMES